MHPPIFLDDSGDFSGFATVRAAELHLEPQDMAEPGRKLYDASGTILNQIINGNGLKVRLAPREPVERQPAELAGKIREYLRLLKGINKWGGDDEWLATASLEMLANELVNRRLLSV